jgi:KDO2-lipid IV(A) lauroyltransferase
MSKAFLFFISLFSRIPFWILYIKSDFLSKILLRIFPYRKKVIDKNLESAFPEKSKKERVMIRRKFYSFFMDFIFEGIKQVSISPDELRKRMVYEGYEAIDALIESGKSAIVITYHYSDFEWAFVGYSAAAKHPLNGIYQPMKNEVLGDLIVSSRSRFGATMIPMQNTYDFMNDHSSKDAFALGLIPDQTPIPAKGYWMEFLGRGTPVYRGPENLAKKFNLAVYTIDVQPVKQGYYKAKVELLTETPLECEDGWITEMFMKRLERKIIAKPEQYLWSHKRWKHTMPKDLPENQISKRYPPVNRNKIDYKN